MGRLRELASWAKHQPLSRRLGAALRVLTASVQEIELRELWLTLAGGADRYSVREPLRQNTWAQSAISVIDECVAGLPMRVLDGRDPQRVLSAGPAFELAAQPRPGQTWPLYAQEAVMHFVEGGECHQLLLDAAGQRLIRGAPQRVEVVGCREMRPLLSADRRRLMAWEWRMAGTSAPPLEIWPEDDALFYRPNPYSRWRGLSALEAAQLGMDADYCAALFNKNSLAGGGSPGLHYDWGSDLTLEQRAEILRYLKQEHSGPENVGKNILTWGGTKIAPVGRSPVELDMNESRKFSREEVYGALRVPPVLAGIVDAAHYNVSEAAQKIMLLYVLTPIVTLLQSSWNRLILPRVQAGAELLIDLAAHPVMQALVWQRVDVLEKLVRNGVPYNEAVAFLNLPLARQPWGDRSLVAAGLETPENVIEGVGGLPAAEQPVPQEEGGGGWAVETASAAAQMRSEQRLVRAAIPPIKARFRALFARQERELLTRLRRALGGAAEIKSQQAAEERSQEESEAIARRVLLDIGQQQQRLRGLARQYFPEHARRALRAELTRLGIAKEQAEKLIEKALKGTWFKHQLRVKQNKIVGIERVTRRRVQATLIEGLKGGENVSKLATRVHEVMGGARLRANTIARTEAGQAVSTGRFLAATAAGAQGKGWQTGANPRNTHIAAGARYAPGSGAIALAEPFTVGDDALMYPRDPGGSAGEIINCNCVMLTVRLPKEAARSAA